MGETLRSGGAYFAIVFLIAFALGALRTLIVAPRLGETLAVLLEAPVVLIVSWFTATWCVGQFQVRATLTARLAMGGVAFALLMAAEVGVSVMVFHRSLTQYLASFGSAAGALGLAAQFAFAWIPAALTWRHWDPLTVVRAVHTAIYAVMATSTLVVLYAGITGAAGPWLWLAGALVGVESVVFLGNRLRCPLTAVAAKYGAAEGDDTFLTERITRHTFHVFGPMILLSAALLAVRWGHTGPG